MGPYETQVQDIQRQLRILQEHLLMEDDLDKLLAGAAFLEEELAPIFGSLRSARGYAKDLDEAKTARQEKKEKSDDRKED